MKIKSLIIALMLFFLTRLVNAQYLDMLRNLNVNLLCILSWVTPFVFAILLIVGAYMLISGTSPEGRNSGKNLIKNALIGLILVVMLILISIHIGDMEALYWNVCWGRAPPGPTPSVNQPPVADARVGATENPTGKSVTVNVGQTVYFDGSRSSDPDGSIVKYSWDFDNSNGIQEDATGKTATHQYSTAGTYTATLTVTDDKGAIDTDTVTIEVKVGGEILIHNFGEKDIYPP